MWFINFLEKHRILTLIIIGGIFVAIIGFVIFIIVSNISLGQKRESTPESSIINQAVDPASGDLVYDIDQEHETAEGKNPEITFVGFAELLDAGVAVESYNEFQQEITSYVEENIDYPVTRISLVRKSVNYTDQPYYTFKVILNIDQDIINVSFFPINTQESISSFEFN